MLSFQFGSRFGASCSRHPIPSIAVGEVVGDVLERVGQEPDLVVVGMTPDLTGTFDDVVGVVRTVLRPTALIATTATAVYANDTSIEHRQGISIWAGRFGRAESFQSPAPEAFEGSLAVLERWADRLDASASTASAMILLTDPFSFPADFWLELIGRRWPGLTVVGGSSSAARHPGGSRFATNAGITSTGAIGTFIYALPPVVTLVSHGASLLGPTFLVTKAERNVVYDLNGQAAKTEFDSLVKALDEEQRRSLRAGVFLGVMTEGQRLREVIGFDRVTGALGLDAEVPVGSTVGFFARNAESVVEDLLEQVATRSVTRTIGSSLLFTSASRRDRTSFAARDSVAALFDLTGAPLGGFSCLQNFSGADGENTVQVTGSSVALFG